MTQVPRMRIKKTLSSVQFVEEDPLNKLPKIILLLLQDNLVGYISQGERTQNGESKKKKVFKKGKPKQNLTFHN